MRRFIISLCVTSIALMAVCSVYANSGAVVIDARAFTLEFASDGRPASFKTASDSREFVNTADPGDGFFLTDIGGHKIRFDRLSLSNERLTAFSLNTLQQAVFIVKPRDEYVVFEIESLKGVPVNSGLMLRFEMNADSQVRVMETDYMTTVNNSPGKISVDWKYIWNRHESNPLGSFALYFARDDQSQDDTILKIWAQENLPHPKVQGEWTYERAKEWVRGWQEMFADQSQFILEADNLQDLYKGVSYAIKSDVKQIYLFTNTWRGGFWPVGCGNWQLRKDVFPNGEQDLKKYSDYLLNNGIYLKLHYLSGSLAFDDPDYVSDSPDERLASWGKGVLARPAGPDDKTLYFRPDQGVELPCKTPRDMYLIPPGVGSCHGFNHVRVDDEIVYVKSFDDTGEDVWILNDCLRGRYASSASRHAEGSNVIGLIDTYGQNFVPENDSTLLEEIAKGYAEFCNRTGVYNVEFDGFENHAYNGGWGSRKFASYVYQNLDHPCTTGSSGGRAPDCWIEYKLNSTKKLMGGFRFHVHSSHRAPLFINTPSRPATSLLETHYELSQGAMVRSCSFGMSKPEPMFGLTVNELETHGLADKIAENVRNWKIASRYLTDQQRAEMRKSFEPAVHRFPDSSRDPRSSIVYVLDKNNDNEMLIKPTKVLTRQQGDIDWHSWQEHGPIVPKQYIKPGQSLELNNPFAAQPPKFIIRVLYATDPDSVNNIDLQPQAGELSGLGDTKVVSDNSGLILKYDNKRNKPLLEVENLPEWSLKSFDMNKHRAIGLNVTGDGSESILVFQIPGRDYVIPINFEGTRYVEIPNGEASWADGRWGWRVGTHRSSYSSVGRFKIGFGFINSMTNAKVRIEGLKALQEIDAALTDLTVNLPDGSLILKGDVSSGQYIEYSGGDKAIVYDKNWNKLEYLPVIRDQYVIKPGMSKLTVSSSNPQIRPWLEVQFVTEDEPMVITMHK
jgi:hypothetical protein